MRVALNGLFLAYPATGTGQYLRELVTAMTALSPQDEFVFLSPQLDYSAPAPVHVCSTRFTRENFAKLEFEQLTFPRSSKLNFDLVHVPHFGSPRFPSRPTVVTIHDLIPLRLPAYGSSMRMRLYNRLASSGARRARAILADSHATARDIETHLRIPPEKIRVVHLAAHARFQPPPHQEIQRVRAKYNLPQRFVLYLGGFDVRKNVARAIEAFAAANPAPGDCKLVLAGKPPAEDSAFFPDPRVPIAKLGINEHVQFTGFVDEADKPGLYAAARVFLYPSQYEGFGLPPLEAMASGTPVIVANTASLPEVVGNAGILLPPNDAPAWRDAVYRLVTVDAYYNDLRARGLEQAKQFSWERAARETLAVYRSVV